MCIELIVTNPRSVPTSDFDLFALIGLEPVMDRPLLSRNGQAHPMGKFDAQLERINVHQETLDRLRSLASEKGVTLSEYVRTILEVKAFGLAHVQMMQAQQLADIVA